MLRFCTRCRGAISVFLTLILVPTFIFGGVLVDGSRILGAKNLISGAGDMALNAALSDYNEELNKTYGLLARARTADEVEHIMQDFFEATLNANGVSKEDFTKALVYLELTNDGFTASDIPGTEIYQTEVLKQEILEYMKYRAPVTLINRAIDDRVGQLANMEKEKNAADGEIKFESKLDGVQKIMDDIKECTDSLEIDYANTLDEAGMDSLIKESMNAYRDRITVLAVAYHRMQNCHEIKDGDTKSLMKEMVSLSCDVSRIDASSASNIIQMIIVKNSMSGRSVDELLIGLDPASDEYGEMEQLINDYKEADGVRAEGIRNTEKQLKEAVETIYNKLNTQRKYVLDGKKKSEKVAELIGDLRDKLEKLEKSYREWENAVAELPEGESREAYEESLKEYAGFFEENRGTLGEFENKINKGVTFYSEMLDKLDDVTFMDKTLDEDITGYTKFYGGVDSGDVIQADQITAKARELMEKYHDTALRVNIAKSEIDFREDAFFKKLKYEYCNTEGSDKAASQAEAEKQDEGFENTLADLKKLLLTDDIENLDMSQWELPSNWLGYRQYSAGSDNGQEDDIEIQGGVKDKKSREQVADSGSGSLNNDNDSIHGMSGLADKMAEVGEKVAEPLFLTEYVIGMFSHYTSNWEDGTKVESPLSLSRSKLEDDVAYRAEVEYILWGSPNTVTNVRITKAIVFTVNLIFNMSFAFTNPKIRKEATGIAVLFPVGALAKTAIKCALQSMAAMMETTKNMMKLMHGEGVALIKNEKVWHTWLSNPLESEENEKYAGMVSFTYEDYLWILVCIKMFTGEQAQLLARTADCIELNMIDKKSDDDNSMKDMYTMIELETSVSIDTFFIQRLSGAGYNTGDVSDDMFKIKYYGIQGY